MTGATEWVTILVVVLVLSGAALAFIGSLGLVRLESFYERVHAPTLGTTLATALISLAALIHSIVLANEPALYVLLILATMLLTTPVSLIVLVRAAVFRDRSETFGLGRADHPERESVPKRSLSSDQ